MVTPLLLQKNMVNFLKAVLYALKQNIVQEPIPGYYCNISNTPLNQKYELNNNTNILHMLLLEHIIRDQ